MSQADFAALLDQYRAGLEVEIALLIQLEALAAGQHAASSTGNMTQMRRVSDERDRLMAGLVTIEEQLKQLRLALGEGKDETKRLPGYQDVIELRRNCVELVSRILDTDKESLIALAAAEQARRDAALALEHGETTLDAYRRAAATPPEATLVNRRG